MRSRHLDTDIVDVKLGNFAGPKAATGSKAEDHQIEPSILRPRRTTAQVGQNLLDVAAGKARVDRNSADWRMNGTPVPPPDFPRD